MEWIYRDNYIPVDVYRERLKLWYTENQELPLVFKYSHLKARTEWFLNRLEGIQITIMQEILGCPDDYVRVGYSSMTDMLADQLLRNIGIKEGV